MFKNKVILRGIILLIAGGLIIAIANVSFLKQHIPAPIVVGPGVTKVTKLSDYFSGLKDSPGDTNVYIMDGQREGGTMVILGGTHPTEPAGLVTATIIVENVTVKTGRLIVIPRANESGFSCTEPGLGHPQRFHIKTEWGTRWFRFGNRHTNPIHQWPDPEAYIHVPSGQVLSATEIRNLNRCYPGTPDGLLTEKIAYGLRQLVIKEQADVYIDMHEAPPEKPLVNAIAAHQRALDLATIASLNMEMLGLNLRLESSPVGLHGFSHREIGDYTDALAVLLEVANPSQGAYRGRTDENLVVTGKDAFYTAAGKLGRLTVDVPEEGIPIKKRCGRHLQTILELANALTELYPDKPIELENYPTFDLVMENGVGYYLHPVK